MKSPLAFAAFIVGAGYLALTWQMPVGAIEDPVGPRMFPILIAIGILLCSAFLWREGRFVPPAPQVEPVDGDLRRRQLAGLLGVSVGTLVYVLTMETLGYVLASFLFLLGLLTAFHRRKLFINVLIAAGLSIVLYEGLKRFLGVSLPSGVLGVIFG